MGWQNLLNSGGNRVLPWLGGNQVHSHDRTWTIKGRTPREFGWYTFDTSGGRTARLKDESEMDPGYEQGQPVVRGFLVGDRLVLDGARVEPDPNKLIEQTEPVFCIERGLGRFVRVAAIRDVEDRLIYMRTEFPLGPEDEVNAAYQDRKDSVSEIPGVTPPLDLAFRWVSYQRAAQEAWEAEVVRGFLVGDRLVLDGARVEPDPNKLIEQTEPVFCIERGLGRFVRVAAVRDVEDRLIYMRTEYPLGPEDEVNAAYQDRKDSVADIPGVTPPLDLAFRWVSYQRAAQEAWVAEMALRQAAEAAQFAEQERRRRLVAQVGTAQGRREMALVDFNAAARAALAIGGAEFLDARDGFNPGEKVVEYRFQNRRLECVCDATTLRIIVAGVCLTDHNGMKGDTWFTLESLPTVIAEAMELHRLVVIRGDEFDDDRWDD